MVKILSNQKSVPIQQQARKISASEEGLRILGAIVKDAALRHGGTRPFAKVLTDAAPIGVEIKKDALTRLINAGTEKGTKSNINFWRLHYIAPFTWWSEKERPFTKEELVAIAVGELKVSPEDIRSTIIEKESRMEELIPFSRSELYRLRAVIIASAENDNCQDAEQWLEDRGLPLRDYAVLVRANGQKGGGDEPRSLLEKLLPHLYRVEGWSGRDDGVRALVLRTKYLSLEELIKAIKNGNGALVRS